MARSRDEVGLGPAMQSRWRLTLVLVLLGALAGAVAARFQPTTYTAEERLAVGSGNLSAQAVPGFALASQELASNYARFLTAGPVRSALPAATARRVLTVTASPVPESNVVRVEVTATDPTSATVAAAEAGKQLVAQVDRVLSQENGEKVRKKYGDISQQVAEAQQAQADAQDLVNRYRSNAQSNRAAVAAAAKQALPAARSELIQASAQLSDLQMQQTALAAVYQNQVTQGQSENNLAVVTNAAVSGDDAKSRLELFAMGGAGAGVVLSLLLVAASERRRPSAGRRAARNQLGSDRPANGLPAEVLLANRHAASSEDAEAAQYPTVTWAGRGEHAAVAGTGDDRWDPVDLEGRRAWTGRR